MSFGEVVDRELIHIGWGFFVTEMLWLLFYYLKRLDQKRKLPPKVSYFVAHSYMGIYATAVVCIIIGALVRELYDLSMGNNPAWKSWTDVGFWMLGTLTATFWGYRKYFWIIRWID